MQRPTLVKFNDFNSFASKAWYRDREGNVLTGEALYVALLFHAAGSGGRSTKNERLIGAMLDDPNLQPPPKGA